MYQPTPLDEYVVTPMPDGTYSVWNEPKDTRYAVWQAGNGRFRCTCDDWTYRCKKWGVDCKHIRLVKINKREENKHENFLHCNTEASRRLTRQALQQRLETVISRKRVL